MYFPYFRGKRFELAMLKDTRDLINASEKIIPIIEPVKKKLNDLQSMLNNFQETKTPVIVIVNPRVGELLGADNSELRILIKESCEKNENLYVAFILGENIQFHDVQQFMNEFGQNNKVLIHTHSVENPQEIKGLSDIKFHVFLEKATSKDYRDLFNNFDCILIRDGFRRRTRNADYPASEYFSDLHKTYQSEGYYGFGDFSIVGDNFSSGGPAYAVAIHLTYLKENGDIWINHFISDRTERPVDPGGKFLEALRKLVAFLDKYPIIIKNSQACQEFKGLFSAQRYPGLGYVKKLSMKHHIELMNFLLS